MQCEQTLQGLEDISKHSTIFAIQLTHYIYLDLGNIDTSHLQIYNWKNLKLQIEVVSPLMRTELELEAGG